MQILEEEYNMKNIV